jgi:hypothetical protein
VLDLIVIEEVFKINIRVRIRIRIGYGIGMFWVNIIVVLGVKRKTGRLTK